MFIQTVQTSPPIRNQSTTDVTQVSGQAGKGVNRHLALNNWLLADGNQHLAISNWHLAVSHLANRLAPNAHLLIAKCQFLVLRQLFHRLEQVAGLGQDGILQVRWGVNVEGRLWKAACCATRPTC